LSPGVSPGAPQFPCKPLGRGKFLKTLLDGKPKVLAEQRSIDASFIRIDYGIRIFLSMLVRRQLHVTILRVRD
jgi:hypothetical protein